MTQYTFPRGIADFSCPVGGCDETCCAVWQVKEGRRVCVPCQYLNAEGLCRIQRAGKGDTLCEICRVYPRAVLQTGPESYDVSLHLSCPRAVDCLMLCGQPLCFERAGEDALPAPLQDLARLLRDEGRRDNIEITDFTAGRALREDWIATLQNRETPLDRRVERLGRLPRRELARDVAGRLLSAANNHLMVQFVGRLLGRLPESSDAAVSTLADALEWLDTGGETPFGQLLKSQPFALENYLVCAVYAQLLALVPLEEDCREAGYRLIAGQYLLFGWMYNGFWAPGQSSDGLAGRVARSIYKQYRFDN